MIWNSQNWEMGGDRKTTLLGILGKTLDLIYKIWELKEKIKKDSSSSGANTFVSSPS